MALRLPAVLSLLLVLYSVPATGQQSSPLAKLELEDLMKIDVPSVFGASKFLQTVIDAPAAVSLVTARDIEIYGYRTLAEIIRTVPGFNTTDDRNYSYVGVRGFQRPGDYNSRVLVMVDGHRINDPLYDMAYLGTEFPIDVQLIDRVELIRGPGASIYGTNAFLGVINIITKKGEDIAGARASSEGGSLQTWAGRATFGTKSPGGWDVVLSGSHYSSQGQRRLYFSEYDAPATNRGVAEHMDGDAYSHIFGAVSFKGLSLQGVYGTRKKMVPTGSFDGWFNDQRYATTDAQGWLDLRYALNLGAQTTVTSRLYYDRANYSERFPTNVGTATEPSITVFDDYGNDGWWGAAIDLNSVITTRHKVAAGAEFRDNFFLHQGGFDEATGIAYLDDHQQSRSVSAYLEDHFAINERFLLNTGIRTDRYEGFGGSTNPRLGLIFKPREKTAIKALWGTAFRAPNAYERVYSGQGVSRPNPNLKPESIRTSEIVAERYFADHYRVMSSIYSSRIRGLISQTVDADGLQSFQNVDSASTRGVEAEIEARWSSGTAARISYSFQDAEDAVTGTGLVDSARHLATTNITVPVFAHGAVIAVDLHAVGPVKTLNGSFTRGFIVPNLTVTTRELSGGLHLSVNVYNVLNNRYGYPGGEEHRQNILYQNGRTFRVSLTYTWKTAK